MGDDLELLGRIEAYDFDAGAWPGYFAHKLAHDRRWSVGYAERVIDEYRRFAYLTGVAGHVVVPSDDVDQAWHQHLLDTKEYWDTFCPNVLRRSLHHQPNRDRTTDAHRDLYGRTLRSYADAFGAAPPDDIWPRPERRFAATPPTGSRRRRRPSRRATVAITAAALAAGTPALVAFTDADTATLARLDVADGSTFGLTFALLAVVAIAASAVMSRLIGRRRGRRRPADGDDPALNPYEAAVLDGAPGRGVSAAVASLVGDGSLGFDDDALTARKPRYRLVCTGPLPARPHPVEQRVYQEVDKSLGGVLLREVYVPLRDTIDEVGRSLVDRGLLSRHSLATRALIVAPLILVGAVGVIRTLTHGNSVLVSVSLGVLVVALVVRFAIEPTARTTVAGDDALAAASDLRPEPTMDPRGGGREAAWIVVLHGPAALAGGALGVVGDALTAAQHEGGASGQGTACGSGGACGGGCGSGCGGGCGGS